MGTDGSMGTAAAGILPPPARRADAGSVRLGDRDVAGLLLCGDMYGAPYDLLATLLAVRPDRARGIVARWRFSYRDHETTRPNHAAAHPPGPVRVKSGTDDSVLIHWSDISVA
jgi:hypothetical protein